MPQQFPKSGWFRAAGSSLPSAEVAGDYFDLRPIGPNAWSAVIADVSGKGVGSALLASVLQGAFLLASELSLPLDVLMAKVNRFLIDRAQREKYATLVCATIDRSGALSWSNAGHCAPILLEASGELRTLRTTGMPLGLFEDAHFEVERLQLAPGDKIVAYSDGLTEAENSKGETFESKLKECLLSSASLSVQEIHDKLIGEVVEFRGGEPMRDDITVLVLEYRPERKVEAV